MYIFDLFDHHFVVLVHRRVVLRVFMTIVFSPLIVYEKMNVILMLTKKIGSMKIQMKIELVHSIMEHYLPIIPMMMIVNRIWQVQYQQMNPKKNLISPMMMMTTMMVMMNKDY